MQTIDDTMDTSVLRLPDGSLINAEWLTTILTAKYERKTVVDSFSIRTGTILKGGHSQSATLDFKLAQSSAHAVQSLFLKRIVVKDLPMRTQAKYQRDVKSYLTEANFYRKLAEELRGHGFKLPEVFHLDYHVATDDLRNSYFILLLDNVSDAYKQKLDLTMSDITASVKLLAALHATFWGNQLQLTGLSELLWERGTYWTAEKRPDDELVRMPLVWEAFIDAFRAQAPTIFDKPNIRNLALRLQRHANTLDQWLRGMEPKTLIHGDFKPANIFFPASSSSSSSSSSVSSSSSSSSAPNADLPMAIDFQWAGIGSGVIDLAYLLHGALPLEETNSIPQLIQLYVHELNSRGVIYDVDTATRDFKIATLNYARVVMAYFWDGMNPEKLALCCNDPGELTHTRLVEHVISFIQIVDSYLSERELNSFDESNRS